MKGTAPEAEEIRYVIIESLKLCQRDKIVSAFEEPLLLIKCLVFKLVTPEVAVTRYYIHS
jgi:hypothetical protein